MKLRVIKLTPEFLTQLLQGKASAFTSNLPGDVELLDLKLDLFSRQVLAVVRSESFGDVAEGYPIPEFSLNFAPASGNVSGGRVVPQIVSLFKSETSSGTTPKQEEIKPAPMVTEQTMPSQTASRMENEFTPEQRKLLSFADRGDVVVVKPVVFLKAEWEDINEVVKSLGGRWVKGDIISYWEIPLP